MYINSKTILGMKKFFLLSGMALIASSMSAQTTTTYNWFDASDCDENGWLWFDSAEKIAKYCGIKADKKIQLIDAGYEDANFEYPETKGDATVKGYNVEGVQGGEGAKTGAIILPESDFSQLSYSGDVNGGGILMHFPDIAKFDLFVSVKGEAGWADDEHTVVGEYKDMYGALYGGDGALEANDCKCIDIWYSKYSWNGRILSDKPQYEWTDIQSIQAYEYNWDKDDYDIITLGKGAGTAVTAYIRNNNKTPWYIHGIRVYTYTNTGSAGVSDLATDATLGVSVNGKVISADNANISVYTTSGALVAKGQGSVDGSALTPGIYVVKASNAAATTTTKVTL
jgi:hypothetical protein